MNNYFIAFLPLIVLICLRQPRTAPPCDLPQTITSAISERVCDSGRSFKEISGTIYWNNSLWGITDDNSGSLLKIDPNTGHLDSTIRINLDWKYRCDWEEITQDDQFIYIGATGNNNHSCTSAVKNILLVSKDHLRQKKSIDPLKLSFRYSDNRQHNCEAMIVMGDEIHLFTKEFPTKHFVLNKEYINKQTKTADFKNILETCHLLITGAATNGDKIFMTAYEDSKFVKGIPKCGLFEFPVSTINNRAPVAVKYFLGHEDTVGQVESISFISADQFITVNENGDSPIIKKVPPTIRRYQIH